MRNTAKTKDATKAKAAKTTKPRRARKKPDAPLPPIAATGIDAPARPFGRPSAYKPEFAAIARGMARFGATDFEIAQELCVDTSTIWHWRSKYEDFFNALKEGKEAFDDRIERSLAQRAAGYSYHSEKIISFEGIPTRVPIVEHVPPDIGAIKLWLGNRRPNEWRDKQEVALTGSEAFVAMWKAISSGQVGGT